MKLRMKLLSDTIFGNGESVPGGEDISVLCDKYGFPYYKAGTFKGIFREELERYLSWTMENKEEINKRVTELLGDEGEDLISNEGRLIFSDFELSSAIKQAIYEEVKVIVEEPILENDKIEKIKINKDKILNCLSHIRAFTSIDEDGVVKEGSLRNARCINKGLYFYSEVKVDNEEDEKLVEEVVSLIKWVGSLRNKGFGKVEITVVK